MSLRSTVEAVAAAGSRDCVEPRRRRPSRRHRQRPVAFPVPDPLGMLVVLGVPMALALGFADDPPSTRSG